MRKLALAALAAAAFVASPAAAVTTITGSASNVTLRNVDPGLVVYANPINFGPLTLDLNPATAGISNTASALVLTIGTLENSVTLFEDTVPYDISVSFTFTDPLGVTGSPITGETQGVFRLFAPDYGIVEWDGPQTFTFGNGGAFSLTLSDTTFALNGSSNVTGRFTLISESAVPEPATWAMMIGGFGMVGSTMRVARRRGKTAFAAA
jgi:hypothetical protein